MTAEAQEVPSMFDEVITAHGKDKFVLVYNAGMAQQAILRLRDLAEKHRSRHGMIAVETLTAAFNQLSRDLIEAKGWTPEELALVDRDVARVVAGKLVDVEGKRILNS